MATTSKHRISRRALLRQGGTIGAGVLLAACKQPTPTPTPKPAVAPTKAPVQATTAPTVAPTVAPTQPPKPTVAPTAAQPVKLVQWDSNPAPVRTAAYKCYAETFNKKSPNVTVEYVPVPINDYEPKLTAAISAGTPPDVGDMWLNWAAKYVGMKALLDLEPYLPLWPNFKDLSPAYLRACRAIENKAYLITWDLFFQGTHYRPDLVKAAGLEDPRALDKQGKWNYATLSEYAKALHKPDKNIYGVSLRGGVGADFTIFNFMISGTKGQWFDDAGVCLLNKPEAVAALEWYSGLHTQLKVTQPSAPTDGFQQFTNLFFNGLAGMMVHNDDGVQAIWTLGREKYATAQMPAGPYGMYMGMVGYGYAVMAGSKNRETAARYVFHCIENGVDCGVTVQKAAGANLTQTAAPMITDMQRDVLKEPIYEPFYEAPNKYPERTFVNPFWLPEYAGLTGQIVVPDFQNVLTGKMKPKEAADRWAAEFTKAQQAYVKAKKQ